MGMMPSIIDEELLDDDGGAGVVEREDVHVRKAVAASANISRHLQSAVILPKSIFILRVKICSHSQQNGHIHIRKGHVR